MRQRRPGKQRREAAARKTKTSLTTMTMTVKGRKAYLEHFPHVLAEGKDEGEDQVREDVNEDEDVNEAEDRSRETALHHVANVVVGKFSCDERNESHEDWR